MPKAVDISITSAAIGLAFAMLASPAAATPELLTGVLTQASAGAGGAAFNVCSYPAGSGPTGYESPAMPCDTRGSLIATMFVDFRPSQIVVDVPQPPNTWIFAACTGDGSPYPGCQDAGAFTFAAAPQDPPPGSPKLSDEQKKRFAHLSNYAGIMRDATGFAGVIYLAIGNLPAATSLGGTAFLLSMLSTVLNDIAIDPIDYNYAEITTVTDFPLPAGIAGKPCMVSGGAALNGPAAFIARSIGIAQAASTSYNRMQRAIAVGDSYWISQQGQAMLSYAAQLDAKLARVLLSTLFACSNVRPATDPAAVLAYERNIKTNGLPTVLANPAIAGGADLAQYAGSLYIADPGLVSDAYNALYGPLASRAVYWQALDGSVP